MFSLVCVPAELLERQEVGCLRRDLGEKKDRNEQTADYDGSRN